MSVGVAALSVWRGLRSQRWRDVLWRAVEGERLDDHVKTARGTYRLNATGLWLWSRCDGRHTGEELILALAEHASISYARAARDLRCFLVAATREGLVVPA